MNKNTIVEIISAVLVLLFVYTAVTKLADLQRFELILQKSPLIHSFAPVVAWALPATELFVATLLIVPASRKYGLYASVILMLAFTSYIAYMIAFARTLPCSCGGVIGKLGWSAHLWFNIIFTTMAISGLVLERLARAAHGNSIAGS